MPGEPELSLNMNEDTGDSEGYVTQDEATNVWRGYYRDSFRRVRPRQK